MYTNFVSPERIRTAPQLNLSEAIAQNIGTVTMAGDSTLRMVEVLPFFPSQVSFRTSFPEDSKRKDSETASVEMAALALMDDEAVQILPTTCDPFPKRSVSWLMTESFWMMK